MVCLYYKQWIQNNKTCMCRCFVMFYNSDNKLCISKRGFKKNSVYFVYFCNTQHLQTVMPNAD